MVGQTVTEIHVITTVFLIQLVELHREEAQLRLCIQMNNSMYLACIKGTCLGSQLVPILLAVQEWCGKCVWYGSDIELSSPNPHFKDFIGLQLHRIGTTKDVICLVSEAEQFLSGVFVAFADDILGQDIELATEDERFREIPNALLEIRAFDTSYFEVYSHDEKIISYLASLFSTRVMIPHSHQDIG